MYKMGFIPGAGKRNRAVNAIRSCLGPMSMPYVIEFDSQGKIIRVTVHGELTDDVATNLFATVRRFLASHDVRGGILDLSPVTSLKVSLPTVRSLSKSPPLFKAPQVRVIVAPSDLIFGMARLFQISRSEIHSELYVVRTLQEAYDIHALSSPEFLRIEHDSHEASSSGS